MLRAVTVGVGAAGIDDADLVLDLGNLHPSTHGALRLALVLDGELIVRAEPIVGYLHRGAEKLFEVRDYRQVLVLANRHDWLSAFANELGIVLAVEQMLGMTVPERAVWLRTLLAELNRVLSHLVFLGAPPLSDAAGPGTAIAREAVQAVLEQASGGRLHFMFNRVGGVKEDVPAGWPGRVHGALGTVRAELDRLDGRLVAVADTLRGVGVLRPSDVLSYGVSGPVARASGVDVDLRRDDPYLAYGDLHVPVVLGAAGDSHDRFRCLLDSARVSLDLVQACLARLPGGPVNLRLPKTVRAPEGSTYRWTESPLGAMGYYLVSRGDPTPWRLAMRTPSFSNASALPALLPGVQLRELVTVLASMFFVVGDIDK